jgi:DNA-binding IclR family transcriptional regulator
MMQAIERTIESIDVFDVVAAIGPINVLDIADRVGIRVADAYRLANALAGEGYVDRDEQGCYATWCAWPRFGV